MILDIRRTVLVRAYVVTIVAAMCTCRHQCKALPHADRCSGLITLLLLAISIKAAFFMYNVDMAILAAPVATLFAFTTLRTALPGAPSGFGEHLTILDCIREAERYTTGAIIGTLLVLSVTFSTEALHQISLAPCLRSPAS